MPLAHGRHRVEVRRADRAGSPPAPSSHPPSRRTVRSSRTRSSLAWSSRGISVISSSSSEPRCASSSSPGLSVVAPVKAPLAWPNSSDSIRSFGQRGAVDLDQRPLHAGALGVDGVGDELLAGAALADDEDVGVGAGHRVQHLEHALHRRRGPEHPPVPRLLGQLPTQLLSLGDETPVLERLAHQAQHLLGVEGLGHEIERTLLRGLHRLCRWRSGPS